MEIKARRRGPPTKVPDEGTMARELHDFRTRMGEERGMEIPRRQMAALITEHKTREDPYECHVPMVTYWETGQRAFTEIVAERYGRVFNLVPLLEWEPARKGARVPQPGQAQARSEHRGAARTALAPEGSWGRAISDLRDANDATRADLARRWGVQPSDVTRWEGGTREVPSDLVERYAAEFGVRPRLRWLPTDGGRGR